MVESGATRILVDCGFPVEGTERRLARIGLAPADITAIVVTHEHGDHADGVLADTAGTEQTQISSKRSRKRRASWNSFRA